MCSLPGFEREPESITDASAYPSSSARADLNGDGWLDVVVVIQGGFAVLLKDGSG